MRIELFDKVHTENCVNSIGITRDFVDSGAILNDDPVLLPFELDLCVLESRILGFCIDFLWDDFLASNEQNSLV